MESCFDIRKIPDLAELPTEDPRRRHLAECPRCRGLAEAHALFLAPGDTSDLEDLAQADAELQGRLAETWALPSQATSPLRGQRRWLALAAVLAVCALGLTAGEVLRLRQGAMPRLGENLRGGDALSAVTVALQDNVLQFTWPDAPAADSYVFVFLGADLAETGRRTGTQALLALPTVDLPDTTAFCQVFAVSRGDTVARSAIVRTPPARE